MLTIEEIKKACEFAEGFEIKDEQFGFIANNLVWDSFPVSFLKQSPMFEALYYPLFLQRVIEGINRGFFAEYDYRIDITPYSVVVFYDTQEDIILNYQGDKIPIDQAKEQAIKYILEKGK